MRARGTRSSGLDALAANRTSVLPFLPTLATALAVGSLAFLCRQPAETESVPVEPAAIVVAAEPGIDTFHRVSDVASNPVIVPGAVAFGQLYPLTPLTLTATRPPNARVAGTARRTCGLGRCEAKRADPVRNASNPLRVQEPVATSAIPLPFRDQADREEAGLPDGALPFTPTAAAVVDTVRSLGSGAANLGSSVLGTLIVTR